MLCANGERLMQTIWIIIISSVEMFGVLSEFALRLSARHSLEEEKNLIRKLIPTQIPCCFRCYVRRSCVCVCCWPRNAFYTQRKFRYLSIIKILWSTPTDRASVAACCCLTPCIVNQFTAQFSYCCWPDVWCLRCECEAIVWSYLMSAKNCSVQMWSWWLCSWHLCWEKNQPICVWWLRS